MPQIDEFFGTTTVAVNDIERDLEGGVSAAVEMAFGCIPTGQTHPSGQPEVLIQKRTRLAPSTAIQIGKALIEAGERLSGPELALIGDMAQAEAEANAVAKLTDPTTN